MKHFINKMIMAIIYNRTVKNNYETFLKVWYIYVLRKGEHWKI